MALYRTKTKTALAIQWRVDNLEDLRLFLNDNLYIFHVYSHGGLNIQYFNHEKDIYPYQWIIKSVRYQLRIMDPDKFTNEYEVVEE